jgi:uncharacterized protein YkwD
MNHSDNARGSRRSLVLWLAVAVAVLGGLLLTRPADAVQVEDEARLYQLTNQARAEAGLPPLAYDPVAVLIARSWAEGMGHRGHLGHNPYIVRAVSTYITPSWQRIGENVGEASSVDEVHAAYMSSPAHRANILGAFDRMGVAAVRAADGRLWTSVVFIEA